MKDGAKAGVQAAYAKLRGLAKKRVAGDQLGETGAGRASRPPRRPRRPRSPRELTEHGAAGDADLVAAAKAFMDLFDEAGARAGKYNVTIKNSRGVQVGDGNIQVNRF